ncbi:MAG: hypothetical protein AAGC85_05540 [Bacteroidota bacterium]
MLSCFMYLSFHLPFLFLPALRTDLSEEGKLFSRVSGSTQHNKFLRFIGAWAGSSESGDYPYTTDQAFKFMLKGKEGEGNTFLHEQTIGKQISIAPKGFNRKRKPSRLINSNGEGQLWFQFHFVNEAESELQNLSQEQQSEELVEIIRGYLNLRGYYSDKLSKSEQARKLYQVKVPLGTLFQKAMSQDSSKEVGWEQLVFGMPAVWVGMTDWIDLPEKYQTEIYQHSDWKNLRILKFSLEEGNEQISCWVVQERREADSPLQIDQWMNWQNLLLGAHNALELFEGTSYAVKQENAEHKWDMDQLSNLLDMGFRQIAKDSHFGVRLTEFPIHTLLHRSWEETTQELLSQLWESSVPRKLCSHMVARVNAHYHLEREDWKATTSQIQLMTEEGHVPGALRLLQKLLEKINQDTLSLDKENLSLLLSQWKEVGAAYKQKIISFSDLSLEKNRIKSAVLDLLSEIHQSLN